MLDFIPLQSENYDLVFKRESLKSPAYKALVDIIQGADFKKQLSLMSGYDLNHTGEWIQ